MKIQIETDYIKLDQLLKLANVVGQGSDAHYFIENGEVKVNSEIENRKRKKIYSGDVVEIFGEKIEVYGK